MADHPDTAQCGNHLAQLFVPRPVAELARAGTVRDLPAAGAPLYSSRVARRVAAASFVVVGVCWQSSLCYFSPCETGVAPIDREIAKVSTRAWAHHIVRLMVFMNYMKIDGIRAYDIYKWFSTFVSLDAHEWVMVSNVAAMGHFDKRFMSRAYVSSSRYVLKMSNYEKDGRWEVEWDARYRKFVAIHGAFGWKKN
jgi:hypothetical protein